MHVCIEVMFYGWQMNEIWRGKKGHNFFSTEQHHTILLFLGKKHATKEVSDKKQKKHIINSLEYIYNIPFNHVQDINNSGLVKITCFPKYFGNVIIM